MWRFAWEEWCSHGLPAATLRVTADGGATLATPGPQPHGRKETGQPPRAVGSGDSCQERGHPTTLAGWPQ